MRALAPRRRADGIAGYYSLAALERGMIGIAMTNSSAVVAPLWGRTRMLGTNPIAIAFPAATQRCAAGAQPPANARAVRTPPPPSAGRS